MRVIAMILAAGLLLAACVPPPGDVRRSSTAPDDLRGYRAFSWGKAGVSFADYETVAFECTARAMLSSTTPHGRDPALDQPSALSPDPTFALNNYLVSREAYLRNDNHQRQGVVDACLTEFGFVRFGLTDEQIALLETLPRGAPERRRFMHSLGTDAAVLSAQRLSAEQ